MARRLKSAMRWRNLECPNGHTERKLIEMVGFQANLEMPCGECGESLRIVRPKHVSVPAPAYHHWEAREFFSIESDGPIESRGEYKRLMKEQGLFETGRTRRAGDRPQHSVDPTPSTAVEDTVNDLYRNGVLREPEGPRAPDAAVDGMIERMKTTTTPEKPTGLPAVAAPV